MARRRHDGGGKAMQAATAETLALTFCRQTLIGGALACQSTVLGALTA